MTVQLLHDLKDIFRSLADVLVYPLLNICDIDVSRLTVEHLLYAWAQITMPTGKRRKRSFVRLLGTIIPFKPPKRLRIQCNMLNRQNMDSSLPSHSSVDVVRWMKEDVNNSGIMVRELDYTDFSEFEEHTYIPHRMSRPERTSTPLDNTEFSCSVSAVSAMEPVALQKLNALEDELALLRNQIASLVIMQEQTNNCQAIPPAPLIAPSPAPPPPPPPPAPPCPPSTVVKHKTEQDGAVSLADLLKQNKDSLSSVDDHVEPVQKQPLSMADVLKNLGTVKLKSIKRSPGGTPLRPKRRSSGCTDPSTLIARAIRKKFKHNLQQVNSPGSDKENEFSSPEDSKSPKFSFGQHILKKTRRHSLLAIDSDKQRGGSPLKDLNG